MPDIEESELRVLLAIVRRTFGWQKDEDVISLSQFQADTGLSRQAIVEGINRALEHGTIVRGPAARGSFSYRLEGASYRELVNSGDQSQPTSQLRRPVRASTSLLSRLVEVPLVNSGDQSLVNSGDQSGPQLVNSVDTQKKELINSHTREGVRRSRGDEHPAVALWRERFPKAKLLAAQRDEIARAVTDPDRWADVLRRWEMAGYSGKNVGGQLDWYAKYGDLPGQRNGHANGNGHRPAFPPASTEPPLDLSDPEVQARMAEFRRQSDEALRAEGIEV
jgi:hypothetical protein